jgi:hypothetical protein
MEKEASRYAYLKVPGMLSHTQSDNSFTYFLCSSAKLVGIILHKRISNLFERG